MASTQRLVQLPGIIRGQGKEVTCTVEALETTLPGVPPAYSRYRVINVSEPLPDGLYELEVQGQVMKVRCQRGRWISA